MSLDERRMAIITAATVAALGHARACTAWPAWIPAVGALVAMTACGIINKKNFGPGIGWGSLIFIGIVLGSGRCLRRGRHHRMDRRRVHATRHGNRETIPTHSSSASRSITIAARFLIVSQTAFINIFLGFRHSHRNHPRHQSLGHRDGKLHGHQRLVRAVPKPGVPGGLLQRRRQDGEDTPSSPNTASSTPSSPSSACSSPYRSGRQWDCSRSDKQLRICLFCRRLHVSS